MSWVPGPDEDANAAPALASDASPVTAAAPTAAVRREICMTTHLLGFLMAVHDRLVAVPVSRTGPGGRRDLAANRDHPHDPGCTSVTDPVPEAWAQRIRSDDRTLSTWARVAKSIWSLPPVIAPCIHGWVITRPST